MNEKTGSIVKIDFLTRIIAPVIKLLLTPSKSNATLQNSFSSGPSAGVHDHSM